MIRIKNNLTPRLPNEYQEVEYIESTGTQCIDTGIPLNQYRKCEMEFSPTSIGTMQIIDGGYTNTLEQDDIRNYLRIDSDGMLNLQYAGSNTSYKLSSVVIASNTKYAISYKMLASSCSLTVNGTEYSNLIGVTLITNGNNVFLFGESFKDKNLTKTYEASALIKLYTAKYYDSNGILIRNFIPCYRKLDNEIGLYDLVNNVFYTNAGTGVFLMGTEVNKADVNLKPLIGNKKVLKRYIGENLVYQKNGDTFFTSCPFPTSWTEVTAGTQYKATNEYGEWNIYADDCYNNGSSGVNKAFDGIVSTAHNFKKANFTNKYIEIDLPNGVLIKPLSPKIIYHYTGTCKFQGFNPNIDNWEDLLTLPANSSSGNKTITDEISTSNFYSKFRVETASYRNKVPTYMCEIEITSGTLRKES